MNPFSSKRDAKDVCDFCLISLWNTPVSINPLYHFVRKSLNEITSEEIKNRLRKINPNIKISNDEESILRYQIKYPCAPALLALAAVLEKKYNVRILSLDVEKEKYGSENWLSKVVDSISRNTKYGVLISIVSTEVTQLFKFSSLLKKNKKELKIVVGGVHATYNDVELLENSNIDYVIRGEGEQTIVELCDAIANQLDVKNIRGVSFIQNEELIRTQDRSFIDLDELPIPAYHYVEDFIDKIVVTTMFARGCPYKCDYCAESAFWSSNVRYKNIQKFVDELELLATKYNQRFIHIADSTFGINREKLKQLCDELEKRKIEAFFSINIRPNVLEYMGEEMLLRLKKLNFVEMYMGVESADPKVISSLNRNVNNTNLIETLTKIKRIGIPFIKLYLMIGSPIDSRISFEKTVAFIESLLDNELIFYATCKYFVPAIGSNIFKDIDKESKLHKDSIRLDRYNSPPLHIPQNTIAQEMDLYLQLLQVVQYKYYLKRCDESTRVRLKNEWEKFVLEHYYLGHYF